MVGTSISDEGLTEISFTFLPETYAKWAKYIIQGTVHQARKDTDPTEMGIKQSEPYDCPRLMP